MKQIRTKSEYEKKGKDLTSYPSQYNNIDYGKKRKAKTHNVVLKDTKTGQVFGYKTVEETMKFSEFVALTESTYTDYNMWKKACRTVSIDCQFTPSTKQGDIPTEQEAVLWNDKNNPVIGNWKDGKGSVNNLTEAADDTRLPGSVISEITGLIRKGAKDLKQAWKNVFELVHTAYHVANVRRPTPDQKGGWKQYEELLRVGVKALADTRGASGSWRMSSTAFTEGQDTSYLDDVINETTNNRKHRIFVRVRTIGFDDYAKEHEVEASSMDEVVQSLMTQAKRNGRNVRVEPVAANQLRLVVYVKGITGAKKDEKIIQIKDWSIYS